MAQELTIGIICEGPTDDIVLRSVVTGFTGDKNILFTPLQPLPGDSGNWDKVFKYCSSPDFKDAFRNPDSFILIQVDTDFLRGDSVPADLRIAGIEQMEQLQILEQVRNKIIAGIGQDFYESVSHRVVFAIAVDQTECWFLAAYYPEKSKAAKYINCTKNLNDALIKAEGFTIVAKDTKYYHRLCRHFKKRNDLLKLSRPNASFNAFIGELGAKLPPIQRGPDEEC